jgi:hypothetical protein
MGFIKDIYQTPKLSLDDPPAEWYSTVLLMNSSDGAG